MSHVPLNPESHPLTEAAVVSVASRTGLQKLKDGTAYHGPVCRADAMAALEDRLNAALAELASVNGGWAAQVQGLANELAELRQSSEWTARDRLQLREESTRFKNRLQVISADALAISDDWLSKQSSGVRDAIKNIRLHSNISP